MNRRALTNPGLPNPAGAYSHVYRVGDTAFTAGFGPQDADTGEIPEGIEAQTRACLKNVSKALEQVGLALADTVKATVHLADIHRDFAAFNRVYETFLSPPYPVRTTVGSDLPGILVEIDVIAIGNGA